MIPVFWIVAAAYVNAPEPDHAVIGVRKLWGSVPSLVRLIDVSPRFMVSKETWFHKFRDSLRIYLDLILMTLYTKSWSV